MRVLEYSEVEATSGGLVDSVLGFVVAYVAGKAIDSLIDSFSNPPDISGLQVSDIVAA